MIEYKDGIDFVLVSYTKPEYAKQCIKSINLFFKDVPKNIYVVCNYIDKDKEMSVLKEILDDDVITLEGVDQKDTARITPISFVHTITRKGKLDGNITGMGSYYGAWATNIGIDEGSRKYVCILDHDSVFLNECSKELMELLEEYCFISNRWDPGTLFRELPTHERKSELGMARPMLFFSKRKFYDDIAAEKYVEKDIWTTSPFNVDWRDNGGNLTWYAQQKNKDFLILPNSYWVEAKKNRYGVKDSDVEKWHKSKDGHILPLRDLDNEQCWIDDKPIHFHHGRGGYRGGVVRIQEWIDVTNNYFKEVENE